MKYRWSEAGHQEREKWILERKIQRFSEKDPFWGVRIYTGREKRLQLQEQGVWKRAPQRHRLGRASRLRILNKAFHSQPRTQQGFEPVRHRTRAMVGMNDMDEQKRGCHLKPSGRFLQFSGKRKGGWETGGQCWGGGRGVAGETLEPPLVNTTFSPTSWAHLRHGFPWTLSNGASCIYRVRFYWCQRWDLHCAKFPRPPANYWSPLLPHACDAPVIHSRISTSSLLPDSSHLLKGCVFIYFQFHLLSRCVSLIISLNSGRK